MNASAGRPAEGAFVWGGGAIFVAALIATGWSYAVAFGASRPFPGRWPIVADALLLTGFAFHHSLFARDGIKRLLARTIPERLLRSVYVWVASVLLIVVCAAWQPVGGLVYDLTGAAGWLCAAVQLAGVWMIVQSVRAIHALELAGIRPPSPQEALQIRGPYGLVRHPLYLGWALLVFGAAHLTGDRLTFAVLTTIYLVVAIPWEERSLERAFGQSYGDYKRQVRWRIVPYIY
jgi:protein-S-isoprenylcysteine O-methyltransferase Ste14